MSANALNCGVVVRKGSAPLTASEGGIDLLIVPARTDEEVAGRAKIRGRDRNSTILI
jgi:hypothetical protein